MVSKMTISTTATAETKNLSNREIKLLNDFSNTVKANEINSGVTLNKLVLTYDIVTGYSVLIDEVAPKKPVTPEV